ncbi:MAG: outer membrane beta-barrel protein [Prevotella sp.]|nr:outer membrane beta-barrel protein [Prevotella sp.]
MKEQTRKDIRQKMADYKQPAPDVEWAELEKALAKNKRAKTVPLWRNRWAAAAMGLLLAGAGWMWLEPNEDEGTTPVAQIDEKGKQPNSVSTQQNATDVETLVAEGGEQNSADKKTANSSGVNQMNTRLLAANAKNGEKETQETNNNHVFGETDKNVDTQLSVENETEETVPADHQAITQTTETKENSQQTTANPQQQVTTKPQQTITYPTDFTLKSTDGGSRLTAQAYFSNTMAGVNGGDASDMVMFDAPVMAFNAPYGSYTNDVNVKEIWRFFTPQQNLDEEIEHHQPLRFGLSLRYQINEKWSVESGLTYTYLSADITRRGNGYSSNTEQRLSYIGIPVSASYKIWGNRHFGIYASVGGMVEKMVKGSRHTQTFIGGREEPSQTEKVSIRPLQFSLSCGAGAEYNINQNFSLYAEPGLTYYFDNHSQIPTFYQDKPFGFNLNLGVRVNFNKEK